MQLTPKHASGPSPRIAAVLRTKISRLSPLQRLGSLEATPTLAMGACMSSGNNEEGDQKKRSQMIDRGLEEDSKKLRRECKILLLGTLATYTSRLHGTVLAHTNRRRRVW